MRDMVALRCMAIASNLAFIAYGVLADLGPVLVLHLLLLPVNVGPAGRLARIDLDTMTRIDARPEIERRRRHLDHEVEPAGRPRHPQALPVPGDRPDRHQQRGQHAAAARAAGAVQRARAAIRERAPWAVERIAAHDAALRSGLRRHRALRRRPQPQQHRRRAQHDRSDQRGDVFAADRVSRRRQRRFHLHGAQLELRALACDVPRHPAEVRAARGTAARALRSADRRARPGAPGVADRLAHQARVLHRRIQLSRHEESGRRDPRAGRCERLRAAERRAALVPADRRRAARARQLHRLARPRRRLSVVLVPQDAGAVRRRRAGTPRSACSRRRCRSCTAAT